MEPTTTPGSQTSEWRATLVTLLTIPGLGAALVLFKDALLTRPWPFVALAIVGAVVAIAYGWQRTWLKAQLAKVHAATPPAVALALFLVPSLALASDGLGSGGISFAAVYALLLGVPAFVFLLVVLGVVLLGRARCLTWLACALVLLVPSAARAEDAPPPLAPTRAPQFAPPAAPAPAAAPAAPQLTTEAFGLCMAQGNVELAGKCTGTTAPLPPDYGKITLRSVIASSVVSLVQIGGGLLTVWLSPDPLGK